MPAGARPVTPRGEYAGMAKHVTPSDRDCTAGAALRHVCAGVRFAIRKYVQKKQPTQNSLLERTSQRTFGQWLAFQGALSVGYRSVCSGLFVRARPQLRVSLVRREHSAA